LISSRHLSFLFLTPPTPYKFNLRLKDFQVFLAETMTDILVDCQVQDCLCLVATP